MKVNRDGEVQLSWVILSVDIKITRNITNVQERGKNVECFEETREGDLKNDVW